MKDFGFYGEMAGSALRPLDGLIWSDIDSEIESETQSR